MLTKEERKRIKAEEKEYKKKARAWRRNKGKNSEPSAELTEMERQQESPNAKAMDSLKPVRKSSSDIKKILSVFPVRDYQDGLFLTKENRILDLFQVQGRSYYDSSDEEFDRMVDDFSKLLRKYSADMKVIAMNYPTNTEMQQAFLTYKLKQPELEKYEDLIQEKLTALRDLEQTTTDREAFIMLFAKNNNQYGILCNLLSKVKAFEIKAITQEKKENILFQLNNMNKCVKI